MRRQNAVTLSELLNHDGLVQANDLRIVHQQQAADYSLHLKHRSDFQVYPVPYINRVVDILVQKLDLWEAAAISVKAFPPIMGRATLYGVPFERALQEVRLQKLIKARFQVPMPERFSATGFVADLLVHIAVDRKDSAVELEAWEDIAQSPEVFYVHGRLTPDATTFIHLDGATISFSPEDKLRLFADGNKIKGTGYTKHFRIDGQITIPDAFAIIRAYLPIEELTDDFLITQRQPE